MIRIEKPNAIPTALLEVQNQIEKDLLEKKDKFKWTNDFYSVPIKEDLKKLYHNKCAFCEIQLTETKTEAKFTVEHYRPKTYYWWLGNEWTNLFPTCWKCNDNKGDDFPLRYEGKRVATPIVANGVLDRSCCDANHDTLTVEEPSFLHPEVDTPEDYFEFKSDGTICPTTILNNLDRSRANTMIAKFLGIPSIIEKRLKRINEFQYDLERTVVNFLKTCGNDYDKKHIKLAFNPFFEKLLVALSVEAEFSRLGFWMSENFDEFFLKEYNTNVQKLIKYAFFIFLTEYSYT